ncbi:hypothetical protein JCM18899A_29990 [Nocardioides sp. AN3]
MRPPPAGPVRPETLYQRNRQTPDRLNNSQRRTYDLLRSTLQHGRGSQYLVEGELSDALSASRNTVRAVLQQLAKEGMVTRSPKRGTHSEPQILLQLTDIAPVEEYGSAGEKVHTQLRTLEYQTLGCPQVVRERLELPMGWSVLMIESLMTQADGAPLGLSTSYIALSPDDAHDVIVDEPDPIVFLEKNMGVQIAGSRTTISATAADVQSAQLVGVELGAPMIFLEDVLEDENGRAWALFQSRLRSDRIAFSACAQRKPA